MQFLRYWNHCRKGSMCPLRANALFLTMVFNRHEFHTSAKKRFSGEKCYRIKMFIQISKTGNLGLELRDLLYDVGDCFSLLLTAHRHIMLLWWWISRNPDWKPKILKETFASFTLVELLPVSQNFNLIFDLCRVSISKLDCTAIAT